MALEDGTLQNELPADDCVILARARRVRVPELIAVAARHQVDEVQLRREIEVLIVANAHQLAALLRASSERASGGVWLSSAQAPGRACWVCSRSTSFA